MNRSGERTRLPGLRAPHQAVMANTVGRLRSRCVPAGLRVGSRRRPETSYGPVSAITKVEISES